MGIVAFVSAAVVGTTGVLADAPDAVATILKVIGTDKQAEDAEVQRLGGPPTRALPPPSPIKEKPGLHDLDDDIPF